MNPLVRNLACSISEADLKLRFDSFGAVQSCSIILDRKSGGSKGFAFIEMPKPRDAKAAVKNLNGMNVDGHKIRVKKS